jgi:hypothetical protein
MKTERAVVATNDIITLADGMRECIADEALEDMAFQINASGGRPSLVEHDWSRPCGWASRAKTEREGQRLKLVVEYDVPETGSELEIVRRRISNYWRSEVAQRVEPFREFANTLGVPGISLNADLDCVLLQSPGILPKLCQHSLTNMDDDGLVPISRDVVDTRGFLKTGDYLLVPSEFLRPSFSLPNPVNGELLSILSKLATLPQERSVRVALDPNRLGIANSFKRSERRDYWWGPRYSGDPRAQTKGLTVHGPTAHDRLSGLIKTEFWWYGKREQTLEIEELVDMPWLEHVSEKKRCSRFVHSVFFPDGRIHLDGAVRIYTEDQWQLRLGQKITEFGKGATRVKLWRIDGELKTELWYDLIHMFFRGNYTVGEYFGLPDPVEHRRSL